MNTRKVFSYGNIVTILICLLPILSIYKFFVPGINLGDFLLMLVCIPRVLYCISHGEKLFKNFFLTLFCGFMLGFACFYFGKRDCATLFIVCRSDYQND